jgi:signal transduction histidine kinase
VTPVESRVGTPREAGQGAALDRVTRTMALALGVGTVVYSLLSVGGFIVQFASFSPIWSWGVVLTTFVPPLAAAALSGVLPARVLRGLLGVAAAGLLGGLLLLVPAITTTTGTVPPEVASPWVLGISAIGTCAAAVAWRPLIAWLYLAACVVTLAVDRVLASSESILEIAIQDALYTLLFNAIFAALAIATAHAGRVLDAAADRAIGETRAAAATESAARERSRIEALVHDSVLVALLASARGAKRAAQEARLAIARLDDVAEVSATSRVATQAWIWRLQSLATDLAPAARFSHEWDARVESIPGDAASAILEATAEAVRNSVQHAGPAARAIHVRATGDEVEVTVLDDGVGFDPSEVGAARLGVAVSILDRMFALSGGRGTVVSQPGVGTRVALGWSPS